MILSNMASAASQLEKMACPTECANRCDEWLRFFARILIYDIPSKKAARRLEREHIENYEKEHGRKPRGGM